MRAVLRPPRIFQKRPDYGEAPVLFDMHVHSSFSYDSALSVKTIVRSYRRHGILPLVCDHNSIAGSERVSALLRERDPGIPRILAEEIMTAEGEIVGLFLNERIPPSLSLEETIDAICDQGGVSLVPHPFCTFRSGAMARSALNRSIGRIDIVEGYNARILNDEENVRAQQFAAEHDKPVSAGSDAHTFIELSRNYVVIEPFYGPEELLRNLRHAAVTFRISHPAIHYVTQVVRFARGNNPV